MGEVVVMCLRLCQGKQVTLQLSCCCQAKLSSNGPLHISWTTMSVHAIINGPVVVIRFVVVELLLLSAVA